MKDPGGTWYSSFVSPSKNIHYFQLVLPSLEEGRANEGSMRLVAAQRDRSSLLTVDYRIHAEIHAQEDQLYIGLLAKDRKNPADGMNVMLLERIREDALLGVFTWNSLTTGDIHSKEIVWTRAASPEAAESFRRAASS